MSQRPYYMAADCPNCGQKDAENQWRGARMGSTSWGHNYSCCSDKCGLEFTSSLRRYEMDRDAVLQQMDSLKRQLAVINGRIAQIAQK